MIKFIGIAYSKVERKYFPTEEAYISEIESHERVKQLSKYLEKMGFKIRLYVGDDTLAGKVLRDKPDLILNLVDTIRGLDSLESCVPAMLELTQTPYTGGGPLALAIDTNKYLTKKLLELADVPTPKHQVFFKATDTLDDDLSFPVISKLNECHGSVAISEDAVSLDEENLRRRLKHLINTYHQSVLVEEFYGDREVCAIVIEGPEEKVYLGEKVFGDNYMKGVKQKFCTFDGTWEIEDSWHYKKYQHPEIEAAVKRAFSALKMRDFAKIDIRIKGDHFKIIDCNHNPTFGPPTWDCALNSVTKLYDVTFEDIVHRLVNRNAEEIATLKEQEERGFATNLKRAKVAVHANAVTSII